MTKTVNLNVRVLRPFSEIVDIAWECANKYVA